MKKMKIDLKINDEVQIIAGDDKGKTGKVLYIDRFKGKVQVEGMSMKTRYVKTNPNLQKSSKITEQKPGLIDISNVKKIEENK